MELFGSRTVWMEQTTSSSRENHPSFWGSQCLQHRAPWSSTGDHSRAAMFGASGTDGFILSRAINVDCVALQAQAGAGFGSLVLCKENACYLPSQPKAGETESSAFQISLPRQGSLFSMTTAPHPFPFQMPPTTGAHRSGNRCILLLRSAPGHSSASAPRSLWPLCWGSLKGCPIHSHSGLLGHCLGEDRGAVSASAQPSRS